MIMFCVNFVNKNDFLFVGRDWALRSKNLAAFLEWLF